MMRLDEQGWVSPARRVASPNFDQRPASGSLSSSPLLAGQTDLANLRASIDLIVVHNISLPPGQFGGPEIELFFTNQLDPDAHPYFRDIAAIKVSAHFLIRRDGELVQFVSTDARAWHAGVSSWQGRTRCNDFSIGIELEGSDEQDFAVAQYECLNQLLGLLVVAYPIAGIVGHSDIAPGRKTDPGRCFDWGRIDCAGVLSRASVQAILKTN